MRRGRIFQDDCLLGVVYIAAAEARMGTIVLLDLMGGVALLLWGLHMVQSGVMRAFGSDLRRLLARALRNRFAAFGGGLALTAVLQSSTATGNDRFVGG
jgi:hypothetical protein